MSSCPYYKKSTKFRKVSHVIFDADGVLLNTEILYAEAYRNILHTFDIEMPVDFRFKIMGRNSKDVSEMFMKHFKLPLTHEQFQKLKEKELESILPKNEILPGAQKLIEHLHNYKVPIAVATSSGEKSFELKTQNHKNFFKLFNHIVLGSSDPEVKNGKPAPDIFLVCASRFSDSPKPDKCLVFEDSPNGVKGALAAGMQVVMVPDKLLDPALTKEATLCLESLEKFKPEDFGLPPYE